MFSGSSQVVARQPPRLLLSKRLVDLQVHEPKINSIGQLQSKLENNVFIFSLPLGWVKKHCFDRLLTARIYWSRVCLLDLGQ